MPTPAAAADDDRLAHLGRLNHIEFCREVARSSGRRGAVAEEDGLLLFASGSPFPVVLNGVWRLDPEVPAGEVLDRADRWFAERGRGYTVVVRDGHDEDADLAEAAEAAGLLSLSGGPEMVVREPVAELPLPDGVELRWLGDGADLDDFVAVSDAAYASLGMPAGTVRDAGLELGRVAAPHIHTVVAHRDGGAVAAAQTILSHGIAGVYWVGTVEGARGAGLGDAVARAVTNRAFAEGATANSLQASPMGEGIYRRMGYETLYRNVGWTRLEPAA